MDVYETPKCETTQSFSAAFEAVKVGKKAARKGWNGKGIFIEAQFPDDHSKMSGPYLL